MLAEIGSPESNANNPEYLFLNEHHQFFYSPFHYSLGCHILVHELGPCLLFTILIIIMFSQ